METASGFMGGLYRLLDWVTKLAYVNLLWIGGMFAGFVLFGIYPATTAMFAVVRKWAMGELDTPIFKTFFSSYKKEFFKSNILGIIITSFSLVLYIDYYFIKTMSLQILFIPFWIFVLLFICTLFYLFPMFVHYEMKLRDVIKNSFFVMIMNPISTVMMLVASGGILFLLSFAPPLLIICSGNILALIVMKPAYNAFKKMNKGKSASFV
ncbi:YesL family protein [Bacillus sp. FJAT-50079]|uniref:YesL family protein n=1 Tax=Bacillus sp. FJAT-50079 TaxID=2833577 RepID=UPI001BCA33EE|nr:YesL family protein [Bacillus sp. FJAT-50079]MBS4208345.1 YesL family protein [Bacillus sp. FJAT-50079]